MHGAELNDLYADEEGKLWRVIAICGEPTVTVAEVEPSALDSPMRMRGGVSGQMWVGFKRLTPES